MNARTAKQLRAAARARTTGQPLRRLLGRKVTILRGGKKHVAVTAVNDAHTTRGLYRAMKKVAS